MKNPATSYRFGKFTLQTGDRRLSGDGHEIYLRPKTYDTLLCLLERQGHLVTKDELLTTVWGDVAVTENALTRCIKEVRAALSDEVQNPAFLRTIPRLGYEFIADVEKRAELATGEVVEEEELHAVHVVTTEEDADLHLSEAAFQPRSALVPGAREFSSVEGQLSLVPLAQNRARASSRAWRYFALVAVGVLATLLTGVSWLWNSRMRAAHSPTRVMLAVLPFQNLTGDPDQEYFADGLTEEMINKLGQLRPEQLGVIARTSVMGYKHSDKRLDQIGRELSVEYILEGSLRREADRLRITAQLIRVQDQTHLWAEEYDRQAQDIIKVQDDVALSVGREIQLRLTPQQRMRLTAHVVSPQAHEAYLRGRFFWNERTEEGLRKAIKYFQAAIAEDPNYAQAYAGLADTYLLLGGYGFDPQKDAMPNAKQAALRAVQIDDTLAEPYVTLGLIYVQWDWNWAEAEKSYKRAIALNPNYSVAHHFYGDGYLALVGRPEEVIAELRKAHELDPLSLIIMTDLAKNLCVAGRYQEGIEQFGEALKIDPDFIHARYYLSEECYERRGMYPEAIAEVQKIRSPALDAVRYVTGQLGHIYALQGRRREALEAISKLQRLSQRIYVDPRYIANIYVALGEKDLAFVWLEKAYEEHSPTIAGMKTNWMYDPIRSDPRFVDLMRRAGIP